MRRSAAQTHDHELADRACTWIDGIRRRFPTVPLDDTREPPVREPGPLPFEML